MYEYENTFFSVIIPVYNREILILETINSVLNQNYKNFELIVVNAGSTDKTHQNVLSFKDRLILLNQPDQGPEIARNTGVEHATGEYLVFLDSDDILLPGALSIYRQIIEREKHPAVILGKVKHFRTADQIKNLKHKNNKQVKYSFNKDFFSKRETAWIGTSSIILKRSYWNTKTCFKSGSIDDLDFMLRIGTLGPCLMINSPETVGYRCHEGNSINDVKINLIRLKNNLLLEHKKEYPGGLKRKFDRLAVIGGHIVCWSRKGFKSKFYSHSFSLLLSGIHTVIACVLNKSIRIFLKPCRNQFNLEIYN